MYLRWIIIVCVAICLGVIGNVCKDAFGLGIYFIVPAIAGVIAPLILGKSRVLFALIGSVVAGSIALLTDVLIYSINTDWLYTMHDGETQAFLALIWILYSFFSLATGIVMTRFIR